MEESSESVDLSFLISAATVGPQWGLTFIFEYIDNNLLKSPCQNPFGQKRCNCVDASSGRVK